MEGYLTLAKKTGINDTFRTQSKKMCPPDVSKLIILPEPFCEFRTETGTSPCAGDANSKGQQVMMFNSAEKEAIGLCISLEALGEIANNALIKIRDVSMYPGEVEVDFHSRIHQELFIIRLLDFVKERGDSSLTGVSGSCLQVLQSACDTCSFNKENSVSDLKISVQELDDWLKYNTTITLWLPNIGIEANIEVSRLDLITISGNQFKHNLSRLTGVSTRIYSILISSGYSVPIELIPLALENFREHFQENYFVYYGTWLTALLNNIRWGIQTYLHPTFSISYKQFDDRYCYEYPGIIREDISKKWFWRLMNIIRTGPNLKKFSGAHYLKLKSSLERCDEQHNL